MRITEFKKDGSSHSAEYGSDPVEITVLDARIFVACTDPPPVYEGSDDIELECSASSSLGYDPEYTWSWSPDDRLSDQDTATPAFDVPEEVDSDETYEFAVSVSTDIADPVSDHVEVTVLNKFSLNAACVNSNPVYEGSGDITLDCEASGAPGDTPLYAYAWTPQGDTQDTSLLSATDVASPTFFVPDEVNSTTTYEYLLTVSAENADDAAAEATVTVLNKEMLSVTCADPGSVYEGSGEITLDCEASGAPGDDPRYAYVWTPQGDTQDTALLSATDIASPAFFVPDEVNSTITYEYLLTVSAENAEDGVAEVAVTVLDRAETAEPEPVTPAALSSAQDPSDPSSLGVTASASSLRFGAQSTQTNTALDPVTDRIATRVSGPYHAGRMTLSPNGGEAFDENGEMRLSIELVSPVTLRREGSAEAASIAFTPVWSYAESCEQLSSQTIGGLYTEMTLSEDVCRLLRFGGELDLTDTPAGHYAGSLDLILRSGEREETFSVEASVTVVPARRVITIGPGGARFGMSRALPVGFTREQNLSIYPHLAFLTKEKPRDAFELSNPSLIPLEVSVSARFGYTEATERGREVVVEDIAESDLGDLSEVVDIHPKVLVLQPGEQELIRYAVKEEALAAMAEKGYAAFFDVVSSPRQYTALDRMPEEITGERTARVTMRVPGVYVSGEGSSQLRARLLSISYAGSMSATFLVETADHPFVGEVIAYDGDGRELGRRETLVYTHSRVRVPWTRAPNGETVFLHFAPRGPGRVPEPVPVRWDAPRREIGEAVDKKREETPGTQANAP